MDHELAVLLTELIEKVGLLRRDLKQKGDVEKYEARLARIDQKFSAFAEKVAQSDPEFAKIVDEEFKEGVARGIARTPTVFVNGEPFVETFTFEDISKSIDAALAATNKAK